MKVATLEKFHLRGGRGWGSQDPGDPGVGKVREGEDFFSFKHGRGLTLDDTMCKILILEAILFSGPFYRKTKSF